MAARNIYLLTPWSRVLLKKLTLNFAASQEIPSIYGCVILPLETLPPPPGDPNGEVVDLRIVLSPEEASLHG
jgi:hypothetical protein